MAAPAHGIRSEASKPYWIEQDMIANLAVIGLDREPEIPDVPLLSEFITDPTDRR